MSNSSGNFDDVRLSKIERKVRPVIVSRNYFYKAHKLEAIVFEIGDKTSRKLIKTKGKSAHGN